jgi:hypothetical protein
MKRRLLTAGAVATMVVGMLAGAWGTVLAANPGSTAGFELDASSDQSNGNPPKSAVTDNANAATTPDDWDRICRTFTGGAQCASAALDHATARSFDSETTANGSANNASIFTGGGSKDQQPVSAWGWKDASGGLPDKDNLLHAMSARYASGGNSYIFFGSDRFDNSGDAQVGFWFFNNAVTLNANGGFTGSHKAGQVPHSSTNSGDILVLSDFTNGGSQPTIRVYEYVGNNPAASDGTLNLLGGTDTDVRDCALVSTNDFCAAVNTKDGAAAPWLYRNKSGQTTFGHGEFYEGGLNLNSLGLQNECFSSFLAETRSSQSVTATLKDFVLGPFQDCNSSTVTTPSAGSDGAVSIGTGSITATDTAVVTVNGTTGFGGSVSFHLCGPTPLADASYTLCATGGTLVGASKPVTGASPVSVTSDAATITSVGRYCWRADYTGDAAKGVPASSDSRISECFRVTPVQPGLTTDATDGPVALGTPISDVAHLTGTATQPNGSPAGGSITFTVYGPNSCTTVAATLGPITVSGDNDYSSGNFTATAAGTYIFKATYTGSSPNTLGASATSCTDANETVVVSPKTPAISTVAVAGPLALGSAIHDTATLSGTANQPDGDPAAGTITFVAYGPNDPTCTTVAFTSSAIAVSGNGAYGSGDFTPTAAGVYRWIATYTGDAPNTTGPISTLCNDPAESSEIISLQPTIATAQRFVPNDSATITVSSGAGNLAGTVQFKLFVNNVTCSGTADYTSAQIDITTGTGTGLSKTVSSSNTTAYATDGTAFSWLVTYTNTNGGHRNVTSACNVEHSSIAIDNDTTTP